MLTQALFQEKNPGFADSKVRDFLLYIFPINKLLKLSIQSLVKFPPSWQALLSLIVFSGLEYFPLICIFRKYLTSIFPLS